MNEKQKHSGDESLSAERVCHERGTEIRQQQMVLVQDIISFFRHKGEEDIVRELAEVEFYLKQPFMIVMVGEFNTGKSALINALLGQEILDMDVTPTTDAITILSSNEAEVFHFAGQGSRKEGLLIKHIKLEHARLETVAIVDTPGTNSLFDKHQQLTEQFVPRADLVIFVFSCQQPLTASERQFLELIHQEWHRKIFFVINKMDLLDQDESAKVIHYTQIRLKELLEQQIKVIPVSARMALKAIKTGDDQYYELSNLQALEEVIFHQLGNCEKWRLKLQTPMESLQKQLDMYSLEVDQFENARNTEIEEIRKLEAQAAQWSLRIKELSQAYIPAVETPFFRFEESCHRFLDQKMNLIHFIKMKLQGNSLEKEFHQEVFDDKQFKEDFEKKIGLAITFVVAELHRFQNDIRLATDELLHKNASTHRQRQSFLDSGRLALQSQLRESEVFQPSELQTEKETQTIIQSVSMAIVNFLGIEALGSGVVAVTLSTALSDVTGVLIGLALASLGFFILPRKRASLKNEFSLRIREIAAKTQEALRQHLSQKIDEGYNDLRSFFTPYVSLCQTEIADVRQLKIKLSSFHDSAKTLNNKIKGLTEN